MSGILYIVATPMGHLDDFTLRARAVLEQVDKIAAEDTRHSQRLLQHYNIRTPMTALHEHNERQQAERLLDAVEAGQSIALISDAGTPLISDPGYYLVKRAHERTVRVVPVPGACALVSALSVSGLPTDRFYFEGFLPSKAGARQSRLQDLSALTHTLVFYEAPHRLLDTVSAMASVLGDTRIATLARELTKTHETIKQAPLVELAAWIASDANQQRGECVLVVAGCDKTQSEANAQLDKTLEILLSELPIKQAAKLAAQLTGLKKNACYARALELKG